MGYKLLQLRGWFGRELVDPLCSKANQGGVEEEEREKVNYWRIICRIEAGFSKQKSKNIIPDDEKPYVKV